MGAAVSQLALLRFFHALPPRGAEVTLQGASRTDVDVTEGSQALAELLYFGFVGLGLVAGLVLGAALLLDVEAQVLEQDDGAAVSLVDDGLDLGADAVGRKGDALAEQLLELGDDGLERVLGVGLAVGAARCDMSTTDLAPCSRAYLMVGTAPTMRCGLVTFLFSSRGTLKSTWGPMRSALFLLRSHKMAAGQSDVSKRRAAVAGYP